ncbi:MAG: hypothetical protein Q8K99_10190 [Actinomycetota bacterium]|nr:hypothetical protein [Actinomycetota bacterium]
MSDLASVPTGTWVVAIVAVVVVVGAGGYFGWKWAWFRVSRRYLVTLIGRRESVRAALKSLDEVVRHLAGTSDATLEEFATDEHSLDRKAFQEVAQRAAVLADELYTMPLPKGLWPAGEALGDAATAISEEAGRVKEDMSPGDALAALGKVDLGRALVDTEAADMIVNQACEHYDVEEASVYGGGLYI